MQNDEKKDTNVQDSHGRTKTKPDKSSLQKLLEFIHQAIEKKDTQQFFAWPVTDQIAPGYSLVISQPMDLNSMKRNIENGSYKSLTQYIDDLQLMCRNAMVYNRPETVYYKAAKKLLHAGLKMTSLDKLRATPPLLPLLNSLTSEELGFDVDSSAAPSEDEEDIKPHIKSEDSSSAPEKFKNDVNNDDSRLDATSGKQTTSSTQSKFESMTQDYSPDEILAQAKNAAKLAAEKLAKKKPSMEMGFLRQKEDGTTTLAIIVPNDGIDKKTRERPVLLGSLIGKLSHGSGSVQGFREDKRNFVKTVKPLYYGAFGSYAPSYDSTFANLTKEESQLLFQTYGDESAVQYAESVLNFSRDSDYVTTMVDNLLDIMTGGDHRKTKKILEEKKKLREEEEQLLKKSPSTVTSVANVVPSTNNVNSITAQPVGNQIKSATVSPVTAAPTKSVIEDTKVEINQLKSLSEYGIDTSFLEYYEGTCKEEQKISDKLEQTRSLLERLHQTQFERLSAPLPQHLSQVSPPNESEHLLADKVTENLTNIIKKVPPGIVAPVTGVRKAMGIAPVPPQQVANNTFSSSYNYQINNSEDPCVNSNTNNLFINQNLNSGIRNNANDDENISTNVNSASGVAGFDLESELREFLESDSALSSFHLPDDVDDTDKTIEQMLSAHS
ncbi:bromodomain-containing protein 7 [Planococcus citri]|uniref:bromodomain-containing protein 7 n=1 Tax=Planococcus citri TaxID=170843 RepID=UPI0031F7FEB1